MDRSVVVISFLLLAVVLSLSGPAAGDMRVVHSSTNSAGQVIDAAVRQLMMPPAVEVTSSTRRLEDAVAPEFGVDMELHRRILASGTISPGALKPNGPACVKTCPARGGSYTGRGCQTVYQCKNSGG
uniref:Uncharacterized protein n=1 Tax=Leersia perrieri TaxID=77586 RepID=A0A0D9W3U1_9ORYZ